MSVGQVAFVVAGSIPVGLAAVALTDLARCPPQQLRVCREWWISVVAVTFLGWLAYLRWGEPSIGYGGSEVPW